MMRDLTALTPCQADRRVPYGDRPEQFFDLWNAKGPSRCSIMMIHGGFWRAKYDLGHLSFLCAALAESGFTVANIEYRRVGNLGGGWPGSFADIVAACKALRREVSDSKIITCGHSAGGHLSLLLAAENECVDGAVALAPVAVLETAYHLRLSNDAVREFMGGTPQQKRREYDLACPSKHNLEAPGIVIHGENDEDVPLAISKEYSATQTNVRLVELPKTGHMNLIDPMEPAFNSLLEAIDSLLL